MQVEFLHGPNIIPPHPNNRNGILHKCQFDHFLSQIYRIINELIVPSFSEKKKKSADTMSTAMRALDQQQLDDAQEYASLANCAVRQQLRLHWCLELFGTSLATCGWR